MLSLLRARVTGLTNVEVREADALELAFPAASFDAVVMANVLHLLPDPARALAEASRVLLPDGRLVAPTFCHGDTLVAQITSRLLALTGFPVVSRFSGDSLRALIEEHDFICDEQANYPGVLPIRFVAARRRS